MQNWWMLYRFIRVWEIPMRLMACVQKRNDPATKVQITKSSCAIPLHSASEESSGRLALRRHCHCEPQSRRMIFWLLSRSLNFTHLLELTISITLCCAGIIQASRFETTRRMSVSKESNGFLAFITLTNVPEMIWTSRGNSSRFKFLPKTRSVLAARR